MTLFEQTYRALALYANQFAGLSIVLDKFMYDILDTSLLNGGVFLAAAGADRPTADQRGVPAKRGGQWMTGPTARCQRTPANLSPSCCAPSSGDFQSGSFGPSDFPVDQPGAHAITASSKGEKAQYIGNIGSGGNVFFISRGSTRASATLFK